MIDEVKRGRFDKDRGLLGDATNVGDQSLDQVILNYLAANKKGDKK